MDKAIYVAMTGAKANMLAQANNSHNLANVNTTGFRADVDRFVSEPVYGAGHPTRVYSEGETAGYNRSNGTLQQTGRTLDVGIANEGWLAVQTADGGEAYTRRGDLQIQADGLLVNGAGELVLGDGGPISIPPNEELIIGTDGTITVKPLGGGIEQAVIDRIRLVSDEGFELEKGEDGLFRTTTGDLLPPDGNVQVFAGMLESSNVNAVEAMVKMIEFARSYEAQIGFFREVERMDSASARLLGTN
ncbi:MAG: flagellar basal-body rod protein FlgF [Pseudomonadota bacterium]